MKHRRSFLIFLVSLLLLVCSVQHVECRSTTATLNEGRKYTCIVNYLRVEGVIGVEFGSTDNTLEQRCVPVIAAAKEIELKNLKQQLVGDGSESGSADEILADCIVDELSRNGFEKSALLRFVYEIAPQYSSRQRENLIGEMEVQITRHIYKANILCNAEHSFSALFDEDAVDEADAKLTPREDYCVRRYIVENELVKLKGVKLEVDLSHEFDCSKKLVKALIKMENNFLNDFLDQNETNNEEDEPSQSSSAQRDCYTKVTHEGDFLRRTLIYDYVREMRLTPRQRGQMKSGYVKLLGEFADKTVDCVSE